MSHKVQRKFALVSGNTAGGATGNSTSQRGVPSITLYDTYDQALHAAKSTIGGYKGYNWVVIYEACTIVRRTTPPVEVIDMETWEDEA